jgi:DNA-binding GntR family transcriptional regulator
LIERIAERIRQKIVQGEFTPGQRLSETALAANLGVSRNTLREVFRLLTQEGLIVHAPNRGVSVTVPGIAAIIDIYRVRRIIECQALAQAYPRHPARAQLRATINTALAARRKNDWQAVGTANMAFHQSVVALADSERLNLMFPRLLAELRLAFGLIRDPEYLHAPFVDMNARIADFLETGERSQAAHAMEDYLVRSERIVLAAYARRGAEK